MARRIFAQPPTWDEETLEGARRTAIEEFIGQRAAEGSTRYQNIFAANVQLLEQLFDDTSNLLHLAGGAALAATPSLLQVARYLGGPPISADDLDTLAGAKIAARRRLDADLASRAAKVIMAALDRGRFPWLSASPPRGPTPHERDLAVRWTAGLKTIQEVQTGRRAESANRQERSVKALLSALALTAVEARRIEVTGGLNPGEFSRVEALVAGTKCDIPIGLRDGRFLFVECKVSNSATNSVKRLNREVGGKTDEWRRKFGERAITAAVLSGVFKLKNLKDAQEAGVVILWEHDLGPLAEFIASAG